MTQQIKLRGDTSANWASANPILALDEPAYDEDTGEFKIGDGQTAWVNLPAIGGTGVPTADLSAIIEAQNEIEDDAEQIAGYVGDVSQQVAAATALIAAIGQVPTSGLSLNAINRTALAALATDRGALLMEPGRKGEFFFDSSNLSAKVTADPNQGIYIAPASDTTGASGAWVRHFDGPLWANWFGLNANGVIGAPTSGADDTAAIQAAVNLAITLGIGIVRLRAGKTYRVDGTIKLGISSGFSSIIVEGGGLGHASGSAAGIATIYHTAKDRPCFNLSRGRGSGVRKLDIQGQNTITDAAPSNITARANPANYVTNSCQDTARAPYCAVAVDGDGLTAPGTPYGGMTYTGVASGTSDWFVEDCSISNFVVGVACQPNHDSNGDFGSLRNTRINFCKVGVSIGNANARSNDFSRTNFYWCYTCIDGSNYRNTNKGNLAGELANIHANYCFQIVDAALNYSRPLLFTAFYCENQVRIGKFISAASRSPVTFAGCTFGIENAEAANEAYVDTALDYSDTVKFDGCSFSVQNEFLTFNGDARFSNCSFFFYQYLSLGAAKLAAFNLCGGVIVRSQFTDVTTRSRVFRDNNHVDSWGALHGDDVYNSSHIYAERMGYGSLSSYAQTTARRGIQSGVSGISGLVISGKTITFTKAGHGMEVGGILETGDAGAVFVVTAVSGNDVTADAISGYTRTAGTYALMSFTAFVSTYFYIPPGLVFKVIFDYYVATTSGSPTAQIKDGAGATVATNGGLSSATKLFWTALLHPLSPFPVKTTVTSVDATTGIITMSVNAIRTGLYRLAPNLAPIS